MWNCEVLQMYILFSIFFYLKLSLVWVVNVTTRVHEGSKTLASIIYLAHWCVDKRENMCFLKILWGKICKPLLFTDVRYFRLFWRIANAILAKLGQPSISWQCHACNCSSLVKVVYQYPFLLLFSFLTMSWSYTLMGSITLVVLKGRVDVAAERS